MKKSYRSDFDFGSVWKDDLLSGFLVFLLALPLSLGIAEASGFPASMGVVSAIIGGVITSFFHVSPLTIKGPAAGMITICAAAIIEFGGDENAYHVVTAALTIAALFQVLFGFFKLGSFSALFPSSAIHGMLTAIGVIIIIKQIPVLLGIHPEIYASDTPIALLQNFIDYAQHITPTIAAVGLLSLLLMITHPFIKMSWLKKIPGPLVVLIVSVPLSLLMAFQYNEPRHALVHIGDFWDDLSIKVNYSWIWTWTFWKYVVMLLLVNSIESLLTVKAVDNLDPYKRKSDYNSDLKALGAGNFISGLIGGLPMISEVLRSTANIHYGAKTKWSNFFHGTFLLLAMLFFIPIIEMIPNAALAAMLIYAGYQLAQPKYFKEMFELGKDQLIIFLATILFTLIFDLLVGVLAGILVNFIYILGNQIFSRHLLKAEITQYTVENEWHFEFQKAAVFTHAIKVNKLLENAPKNARVIIDFSKCRMVDNAILEIVDHYKQDFRENNGDLIIEGLDLLTPLSKHPLATRRLV